MTRWWTKSRPASDPVLSIVVPVYEVRDYLDACLDSLVAQDVAEVEIIVVDDGSTDGSARIARRHARRDPRIRVVSRPNGGLSAARNTGIAAARAPFLTFVDSDDLVTPSGFAAALKALSDSGSDFAMLPYRRFRDPLAPMPYAPWIADLYRTGERTLSAHEHPELLVHATAWSKVYRRSFWDAAGLRFTEGILYEDQDVTARAFVAANQIDLVPEPAYLWRRARPGSITNEASAKSIAAFLDAARVSLDVLKVVPGARSARASQLLCNDLPRYLAFVDGMEDPTGVDRLFDEVVAALGEPDLDLDAAPVGARVVYALLLAGRRADAVDFIASGGLDSAAQRADEVDGAPALLTSMATDPDVPASVRVLTAANTPLDVRVTRLDLARGEVTVLAWLRHLDRPLDRLRAWWVVDGVRGEELSVRKVDEFVGHRIRTTREANERSSWEVSGPLPASGAVAFLEFEGKLGDRRSSTRVELIDASGSAGIVQHSGPWSWDPASARLVWAHLPQRTVGTGAASEVTDGRVLVAGSWRNLPGEVGDHVVAQAVTDELALRLPIDLPDGWLGLRNGTLVWKRLAAGPRERLTYWWSRDHAD